MFIAIPKNENMGVAAMHFKIVVSDDCTKFACQKE